MKKTAIFSFLFLPMLLLATSCVVQGQRVAPVDYSQHGRPPVPASVLLLIPEEFQGFVYVSTYEGNEIRHPLGREGARELRAAFGIEFASVEVRTVRSEAEAMAMLDPKDPVNVEVRAYDYVVIPRFMRVDSSVDNQKYGFEIDLLTEVYAKDGASVTKIKGHGETSTGKWSTSTPEEGVGIALQSAVSAILDGIEESRSLFVH
jgi:hypothetical protein